MYNSSDDMKSYTDAMNSMADNYPQLIAAYDEAGNAIIDLEGAESLLISTRMEAAAKARLAAEEEAKQVTTELQLYEKLSAASAGAYTEARD